MPASSETAVGRGDRPVSWVVDATAADDMCSLAGARCAPTSHGALEIP
jgi:hypothetical protein